MTAGLAITAEPVVALNPVPGDHVNVAAPLAVKVVLVPEHIAAGVFTVTVNEGTTVTVEVATGTQPPPPLLLALTVYTVVTEGETATEAVVALPAFALHV